MSKRTFNIGTQLRIGFAVFLALVFLLGVVSYVQTKAIQQQTEIVYNHPLQVSKAISMIETQILSIEVASRDLAESTSEDSRIRAIQDMEIAATTANKQFNIVIDRYLGPHSDVDDAFRAFSSWRATMDVQSWKAESKGLNQQILNKAKSLALREKLFSELSVIETFATNKANSTYEKSQVFTTNLIRQLIGLVFIIFVFSVLINFVLMRNIQKPLGILMDVTQRFRHGDMNARSSYHLSNEFGLLSESFNKLADRIQQDVELSNKRVDLSTSMLGENDERTFFQAILTTLLKLTESQMAAIYLQSEDEKKLELYESIGLNEDFKKTYNLNSLEGEMGLAMATRKVQYIKTLKEDEPFLFLSICGNIKPREIIIMPIYSGNRIIASIHLASINSYTSQSSLLVESILETLSARVGGILTTQKIKAVSDKMEKQNRELEMQKTELTNQSTTLQNQNTELEIQKKQLDEANKLKTIFLSNMSHELRTPLNSVIALSGVLNRRLAGKIQEEEYSYLEVIERNGKHLLSLINDILDLSRIEAGREDMEIVQFNAAQLVSEIVDLLLPQAREKNIELKNNIVSNDLILKSDLKKCRHILQNIVGNAVKFTEKGKVEIFAKNEENTLLIEISDTGIGISKSQMNHIFDEFRQADNSTSRKFGGTGLGLSIAKKYSEMLGGTITVESMVGEGSVFSLRLPLQFSEEAAEIVEIQQSIDSVILKHASETDGKTILLVEDSEPAIIQLTDVLQEGGYRLQVARNGMEALERIGQTIPDAMILDLMMPGMDGFDVLKTLRGEDRTAHVPVLILTAKHITKEELHFLKRNNIHQLVQKGDINRKDLLKAVEDMAFKGKRVPYKPIGDSMPIILVVEDNPDNMVTARALLSDHYKVLEAVDGNEALSMARMYLPNLILMDIELPGMDGIETFKIIRSDVYMQNIPVVALTASAMTSERESILAFGFDGYIAKPIDEEVFTSTIKHILYG